MKEINRQKKLKIIRPTLATNKTAKCERDSRPEGSNP